MSLGGWQTAFSCITCTFARKTVPQENRVHVQPEIKSDMSFSDLKFFCETLTKCFPKLNNVFFAPKLDHTSFPNPNQALFMHEYNGKSGASSIQVGCQGQ